MEHFSSQPQDIALSCMMEILTVLPQVSYGPTYYMLGVRSRGLVLLAPKGWQGY
jgi:hypothetical protein